MEKKEGAGPTRNLFPTCQDDSTRAVGAHPWMITWTWSDPRGADKKSPMYLEPWSPSTTPFLSSFFRLLFVYNPLFRIVRTRRNDARGGGARNSPPRPRICRGDPTRTDTWPQVAEREPGNLVYPGHEQGIIGAYILTGTLIAGY